ncbi:hypothetical protein QBA78_36320 [Streptomyces scabiei]|uniref:hypothetical protein n=1 Tax=Streptomyces scabiei TaxID=1930 RepID=UPI002FF360D0
MDARGLQVGEVLVHESSGFVSQWTNTPVSSMPFRECRTMMPMLPMLPGTAPNSYSRYSLASARSA